MVSGGNKRSNNCLGLSSLSTQSWWLIERCHKMSLWSKPIWSICWSKFFSFSWWSNWEPLYHSVSLFLCFPFFPQVAWYTQGGFTDEYGEFHKSNYHYDFPYWEVLNEVAGCHGDNPEKYTLIYDEVVKGIRRHADPEKKMKFVGLALQGGG